jgi:hypothetical protein
MRHLPVSEAMAGVLRGRMELAFSEAFRRLGARRKETGPALEDVFGLLLGRNPVVDRDVGQVADAAARRGRPVGCRVACAMCCHQDVLATTPEILLVHLSLQESPPRLARVVGTAARTRDLTPAARFAGAVGCAFLEDRRCGIYEYRPAQCRSYLSVSRPACEADWEARARPDRSPGIPLLGDAQVVAQALAVGFDAGHLTANLIHL